MKVITGPQAAELLGVTTRRLYQIAKEADPPPKDSAGKYPCREYGDWLRKRHLDSLGVQTDGEVLDLTAERARLAKAQADKTELEVEQLHGRLIPADLVIATWQALIAAARARLLSLPTKTAHVVIAATELPEIEAAIKDQVYEALKELDSDGLPDSVRDLLASGSGGMEAATKPDRKRVGGPVQKTQRGKRGRTGTVAH